MQPGMHMPGQAFDEFIATDAPAARNREAWQPGDPPLPSLYISHGAPPLFDDPDWIADLFAWGQKLPQPQAILIVSAHWEAAPLTISSPQAGTPLVYDFSGFAPRYFRMEYATPAAHHLADRVTAALPDSESVYVSRRRGLDHGAWVPLKVMYPWADVPVVQLSMPTHDPARLLDLGAHLAPLRSEGVLIIGSGFMTHGLPFLTPDAWNGRTIPTWSADFDDWATEALQSGDVDRLADYRDQAPGMPYAHPTVEHFTPLFVTLGASDDASRPLVNVMDGFRFGLSRRSLQSA